MDYISSRAVLSQLREYKSVLRPLPETAALKRRCAGLIYLVGRRMIGLLRRADGGAEDSGEQEGSG
jgi:hypothetical protein